MSGTAPALFGKAPSHGDPVGAGQGEPAPEGQGPSDLAMWLEPIAGEAPGGRDARHEPEHERIRGELEKLSSVRDESVDWQLIRREGQALLQHKVKDLLIGAYLACAWAKLEGLPGLARGMNLLASLLERYPDALQPQRPRGRAGALSWFAERATELLAVEGCNADEAAGLRVGYGALLAGARAALGDECPSLSELGRSVERAALSVPKATSDGTPSSAHGAPAGPPAPSPARGAATDAVAAIAPAAGLGSGPVAASAAATTSVSATGPVVGTAAVLAPEAAPVPAAAPVPVSASVPITASTTAPITAAALPPSAAPVPASADSAALAAFLSATADNLVDTARVLLEADLAPARSYRLLRIGLWLELESLPPVQGDGRTRIRAPEKRLRDALAALLAAGRWDALLSQSEASLRTNPLWLEASWLSARALEGLGEAYVAAKMAVESESRALIRRLPQLLELRFIDGTPIASPEAAAWLRAGMSGDESNPNEHAAPALPQALQSALGAARAAGDAAASRELERLLRAAPSARVAFQWRLALARSVESSGKLETAAALYLGLERDVDAHRLEDWEPELARDLFRSLWALARRKASLLPASDTQRICVRLARLSPLALT